MIELRSALQTKLETLHPRVFYETAPDNVSFPYVVFDLPNSFRLEDAEVFNLDVDVWDRGKDTTELETLTTTIERALNGLFYNDAAQFLYIYRESRLRLDSENLALRRRQIRFSLKYYTKEA